MKIENNTATSGTNSLIGKISSKNRINLWACSTITLLLALVGLLSRQIILNQSLKETPAVKNEVVNKNPELSLYFSKQHLDQPLSQYDHALLASPYILNEQRGKTWQSLECIYPSVTGSTYTLKDIKKFVTDDVLLDGLQKVEEYRYKTTLRYANGEVSDELMSLQDIYYSDICKDSSNYFVFYLTTGDRSNSQGSLFVKNAYAAGGWLGQSHFAVIPFDGEAKIFENVNDSSKNISVNDLVKSGLSSSTSRSFAYYACHKLVGKLGDNLYAICGGEGGSGLFKIPLNPISFNEVSFCWWKRAESESTWVCYDKEGKVYYQYK